LDYYRIKCTYLLNPETTVIARIVLANKAGETYLLRAWFFNLVCIYNKNFDIICLFFSKDIHIINTEYAQDKCKAYGLFLL
jgi:hypothetical protein